MLKIGATTLGETGGDAVSMSMNLGCLVSSLIFMAIFIVVVIAQISTHRFRAPLYWTTIIATTTVADFADRSLGIGYAGGTSLLFSLPMIGGVSEREDHGEALSSVVAQWVCSLIELYGGFAAVC